MLNLEAKGMPKTGNLDLEIFNKGRKRIILTKEFWNYLSVRQSVTQTVWNGGKAATGGYTEAVIK